MAGSGVAGLREFRPGYRHLLRMSDSRGIFEHAKLSRPRLEHGYCTDDNARLAIVASRGPVDLTGGRVLVRLGTRFVLDALAPDGSVRNRMNCRGLWEDEPALEDAWGRAVWALGTVAARATEEWLRREALDGYRRALGARSGHLMSNAFAALGAAEVLRADPEHVPSRTFLYETGLGIASRVSAGSWPWPENRLRYSNATLPEVMIAAGMSSGDRLLMESGVGLLEWLWRQETTSGRLSVTPAGGRGPGDPRPAFDQQPIEVVAMADACDRARAVTGSAIWAERVAVCASWFLGNNDVAVPMVDFRTSGGYDGLQPHGPNLNQGAESTLAMIATMQRARNVETLPGTERGE